ncbi:hypothetical protein FLLO111716_08215 [Flavobacterium longum]|uniref:hypothetical protein n=1 Tax=Flavobacterium longum TaxID=1299340 RepID=UPI0039ED4DED
MENLFLIQDDQLIEEFRKTNPTKEDYADIVGENDPEFLRKYFLRLNPSMTDEDIAMHISLEPERAKERNRKKRYEIVAPDGFEEIQLYDHTLSHSENFEMGNDKKYILLEVTKEKTFSITSSQSILPTPQSKCVIDIGKVEKHSSLEFIPIDYEPFFGVRLTSFIGYDSNFFSCDERVVFESLLIKFKNFKFKPFHWSKEKIYEEVGVKKDRATKILEKFIELGIVTKEVRKTFVDRPLQVNYFDLNAAAIIGLVSQIFKPNEEKNYEQIFATYLRPALFRQSSSRMQ